MGQNFANKSAKILVIEGSQAIRGQLVDVFKAKGFEKPESSNNITEAIIRLGSNTYDWILTSLAAGEPENGMQLLKLSAMYPQLRNTRITFNLEETEKYCLPLAFELGLLTWHNKKFTKDEMGMEIETFMKNFAACNWGHVMMAAHSLRGFLKSKQMMQSLINLEDNLSQTFPTQTQLLLNVAEAQFLAKQPTQAIRTLYHLAIVDPTKGEAAKAMATNFGNGDGFDAGSKEAAAKGLGLSSCLIVDSDSTIQTALTDTLKELGVSSICAVSDGQAAIDWIKSNPKPNLIIQEWRIPKLSGPGLVQQLRRLGHHDIHVVVLSSLLKATDHALVREMGIAATFEKPFSKDDFVKALVKLLHQECLPTEPMAQERKIRQLLAMGKRNDAMPLRDSLFSNPMVTNARKDLIAAEFLYVEGHFEASRDLAMKALRAGADSLQTLNLMGKCMMQLKDFESSAKCFERAQEISPSNIERLCALAEVQQELGNADKANAAVEHAAAVNASSQQLKETDAKLALAQGNVAKAKNLIADLESLHSVVTYLNNRAVSLSRSGKAQDSIAIYKNALLSIPPARTEIHTQINYNLSLAYVRIQDLKTAITLLGEVAAKNPDERVKTKTESLKKRLEDAMKSGQKVVLRDGSDADKNGQAHAASASSKTKKDAATPEVRDAKLTAQNRAASFDVLATMSIKKGEICLFKIFSVQEPVDKQALVLIKTLPKFQVGTTLKSA